MKVQRWSAPAVALSGLRPRSVSFVDKAILDSPLLTCFVVVAVDMTDSSSSRSFWSALSGCAVPRQEIPRQGGYAARDQAGIKARRAAGL